MKRSRPLFHAAPWVLLLAVFALFSKDLRAVATTWFLLTHKVEIGALDDFVLLTVVGGRIVYHRPGEAF